MKKFITISTAFFICIFTFSQAPEKMSYQAVIRDGSGNLIVNQTISIRVQILADSQTGITQFSEYHNVSTNKNGLVSFEIGNGSALIGEFSEIDWSAKTYFLKIEIDQTGGSNYSLNSVSQILSVPYALYANKAGNGFSGKYEDILNKPELFDSSWVNIKDKPTTIAGYGLTDAVSTSNDNVISGKNVFTGLVEVQTPLNANDAVNKAYVDALLDKLLEIQAEIGVRDIDGNVYKAVKIGNKIWMAENLKTSKYRNGDVIETTDPLTLDISWESNPKYQWIYNGDESNLNKYGRLYTWYAITDDRNVCPLGWHVPSDYEWNELQINLGMNVDDTIIICDANNQISGKLKETGTLNWISPNIGATNEIGFTALPSGYRRRTEPVFEYIGEYACFWSKTEFDYEYAWYRHLYNTTSNICRTYNFKNYGFSVRCVKD